MNAALEEPAYNITLQSAPVQEGSLAHYHWRIEIVPRITRDAGSGFEWCTDAHVNPTAPEEAAQFLREALID
jgi:UDPglucose--hexose-1-phosphate uridylyltransferase